MIPILEYISLVRDSFHYAIEVYSYGSCVKFAYILKALYPSGEVWYNSDHAIFKLNDTFYDITGVTKPDNHIPITEFGVEIVAELKKLAY